MDTQTLGAAVAICKKQVDEAVDGIIGTLDGVTISVSENKLVFTENGGES